MRKNGFTLIEILAVVIILGVVAVITMPIVQKNITNSKKQAYATQLDNIIKAAKDWSSENLSLLPTIEGSSISITLSTLMSLGYIDDNLVDPLTEKYFDPNTAVSITRKNRNYKYKVHVIFNNESTEIDKNAPIILLNGDYVTYVDYNGIYEDLGIYSDDDIDYQIEYIQILKDNEVKVDRIDTSALNKYKVRYIATASSSGKISEIYRTVVVKDMEPPVITVPITQTIETIDVETYDLMAGVSVTDNSGEKIKPTVGNSLKPIAGEYIVTYTAVDSSGNKKTKKRTIIIENPVFTVGEVVYYDPVTTNKCSNKNFSVDNIKSKTSTCYKWNVININDSKEQDKIDIMLDHNLSNQAVWSKNTLNYKGPIDAFYNTNNPTLNWSKVALLNYTYDSSGAGSSSYGTVECTDGGCWLPSSGTLSNRARIITAEEFAAITSLHPNLSTNNVVNNWSLSSQADGIFYFSNTSYAIGTNIRGVGDTSYSWLLANTTANSASGATDNIYGQNNLGYWTLSPYSGNNNDVWVILSNGSMSNANITSKYSYGFRPIISVDKIELRK